MRHQKRKKSLGRERAPRNALLRNLVESIILHGAIITTVAKAKTLRGVVEPLVTRAKSGTVADRRRIASFLYTKAALQKLFLDIAPRYRERNGGYTRVTKIGVRANDKGEKARIEFV